VLAAGQERGIVAWHSQGKAFQVLFFPTSSVTEKPVNGVAHPTAARSEWRSENFLLTKSALTVDGVIPATVIEGSPKSREGGVSMRTVPPLQEGR